MKNQREYLINLLLELLDNLIRNNKKKDNQEDGLSAFDYLRCKHNVNHIQMLLSTEALFLQVHKFMQKDLFTRQHR